MANMKALLVIATLCIWCTLMVAPTRALTFDVSDSGTVGSYSASLQSLRDAMKATAKHGLPVMRNPSTVLIAQRFLILDVKFDPDKYISVAIDITNLYVVAYRDTFEGKDRAHFFPDGDAPKAKSYVFKGSQIVDIPFKSTYGDMERPAKQSRQQIELGISKLKFAILAIYGKQTIDQKAEAKFLIILIQMVSEAARFKYIQNKVVEVGEFGSYVPDFKTVNLENNWGGISTAIQKAGDDKNISPALQLRNADNTVRTVTNVDQIAPDMGILKYP